MTSGAAVPRGAWRTAAVHGSVIAAMMLGLVYHWFAVADRYAMPRVGFVCAEHIAIICPTRKNV